MAKDAVTMVLEGEPDGDETMEDAAEYSDLELGAAEDLASAVKSGDAEAIVDAYKALKAACESTYSDEEDSE